LTKKRQHSPLTEALLEMADDLHRVGILDNTSHRQITVRHVGDKVLALSDPISGNDIRLLRERENLSQAALARYLNLTVGFVSQLERGTKQPKGPALVLLNVIRRKGLEAIA
jgi:putative transcriptional regulator